MAFDPSALPSSELPSFAVAFAVVFLAELGDKTQLALLALSVRMPRAAVLVGALAAFAILTGLAVAAGTLLREFPRPWVDLAAGLAFVAFGLWTLKSHDEPATSPMANGQAPSRTRPRRPSGLGRPAASVFLVVVGAEFLDKTQLATAGLASAGNPVAVAAGSFLALSIASVLAILAGAWLSRRVDPRRLRLGAAVLFLAIGALLLVRAAATFGPLSA